MKDLYVFTTTCVNARAADIIAMCGQSREITRRTFCRYVGADNAGPAWDHHVRYYRSYYRGRPCVYMDHSAIEHVFVKQPPVPGVDSAHAGNRR